MTRIDALTRARRAIEASRNPARGFKDWVWTPDDERRLEELLTALESAGLLKYDEAAEPKSHWVPALNYTARGDAHITALIREETLVETLRGAGYVVTTLPYKTDAHGEAEMALRGYRVSINCQGIVSDECRGHLNADGAAKIINFLRSKGFRITSCA